MKTAIVWFRRDLRLADQPALTAAIEWADRVVPVFIHAPAEAGPWRPGAASQWWLHHSLIQLSTALAERGARLVIRCGESLPILRAIAAECGATAVFWNRLYEPALVARDTDIKQALREDGLDVHSFNGALLVEPWQLKTGSGEPYRVFTPFWRAAMALLPPQQPVPAPQQIPGQSCEGLTVDALALLPRIAWDGGLRQRWRPGEPGALAQLDGFCKTALADDQPHRDQPATAGTSSLSPYLHFGEIGPRQILARFRQAEMSNHQDGVVENSSGFLRQIGWREFSHHQLFHFPHTSDAPLQAKFEHFPWRADDSADLQAWQQGRTGIPLVDAGMRELWHSGWMHNRVRMVVASFLTKNLLIRWQQGAKWFWDTLVDADLAQNSLGWQWTAGCGADAAPYFRVFNPVLQSEKFDAEGDYIRQWLPQLKDCPSKFIHAPWRAPAAVLQACGLVLGRDYPAPMVDLKQTRQRALEAYQRIKAMP